MTNVAGASSATTGTALGCVTTTPPWPDPSACRPAPGSPLVGTWQGHWPLNSINDASGIDNTARLTVSGLTSDGVPCGTLRIGDAAPLPAATDPGAAYPPAPADQAPGGMQLGPQFGSVQPDTYEGFSYSLVGVISDGTRLAFRVELEEPWRGWCALQTPPSSDTVSSCLGPVSSFGCSSGPVPGSAGGNVTTCSDGSGKPIAFAQANLCGQYNICQCQAGCCDGSTGVWVHALELHRRSDGTLEGSVDTTTPVYFDPAP